MNINENFDFEDDNLDIEYQLALLEILTKLKAEWEILKSKLTVKDDAILKSIKNIDNLLNYYYQ